jgi:hypothetical protein
MQIECPDEWLSRWAAFDHRFDELVALVKNGGGISSADISAAFRLGLGVAVSESPAFVAWAAVKHNATRNAQIRDRITEIASEQ